jgi:hypothetical protein
MSFSNSPSRTAVVEAETEEQYKMKNQLRSKSYGCHAFENLKHDQGRLPCNSSHSRTAVVPADIF